MTAASRGDVGTVQQMLGGDREGDPISEEDLDDALSYAASKGHLEIVRVLFSAGARINSYTLGSLRPGNYPSIVKEFLDRGWNPNTQQHELPMQGPVPLLWYARPRKRPDFRITNTRAVV